jgi:hypothetical protein
MPIDPYYDEVKEEQRKNVEGASPYEMDIHCDVCKKIIPIKLLDADEYEFYVVDQGYNIQGAVEVEMTKDYIICHTCMEEMIRNQKEKQYIEEIGTDDGWIIFKCRACGYEFTRAAVNLEAHSIFCPECDLEHLVNPETNLYEDI